MKKTQNNSISNPEIKKMTPSEQPFAKANYWLMAGCALLIVIGFLLMLGGGSSVEKGFNPDIFSTRRIVVGPLLAFIGFLLMAFAILVEPEKLHKYLRRRKAASDEVTRIIPGQKASEEPREETASVKPDEETKK